MSKNAATTQEFQVYKEGVTTNGRITILSMEGEYFDRAEKIRKYLGLGYDVYTMEGEQITKGAVMNPTRVRKSDIVTAMTDYRDGSPEYLAIFLHGEQYGTIDEFNRDVENGKVIIIND